MDSYDIKTYYKLMITDKIIEYGKKFPEYKDLTVLCPICVEDNSLSKVRRQTGWEEKDNLSSQGGDFFWDRLGDYHAHYAPINIWFMCDNGHNFGIVLRRKCWCGRE